jgi:hypothetical protein|tara:strand:- start:472 stop:621 length:150 start_codon:yes stop_codon:yes gene_type:complete
MIVSDKIIPIYKNGHGIHDLIVELQRQARELKKKENDCSVVKLVNTTHR